MANQGYAAVLRVRPSNNVIEMPSICVTGLIQRVLVQAGLAPKVVMPRASMVDPYVAFMLEVLEKYPRLHASRLFQMLQRKKAQPLSRDACGATLRPSSCA